MEVITHSTETLREALISRRPDLVERYKQYTEGERRVFEDCLRPDSILCQPITTHSDSDWIRAHPEESQDFQTFFSYPHRKTPGKGPNTIYIQTIGEFCFSQLL